MPLKEIYHRSKNKREGRKFRKNIYGEEAHLSPRFGADDQGEIQSGVLVFSGKTELGRVKGCVERGTNEVTKRARKT